MEDDPRANRSTIPLEQGFTSRAGFVSLLEDRSLAQTTPPPGINCERRNAPFAIPDEDDDSLFRTRVFAFTPESSSESSRTRFRERGKSINGERGIIPTESPRVAMVVRSGGCTIIPRDFASRGKKPSSLVDLPIISSTIDCLFSTILRDKNLAQFSQ